MKDEKIITLINLIDNRLLTKEFIIENMRKNNFISLIFLGEYKDSYLYKYSDYYDLEEGYIVN